MRNAIVLLLGLSGCWEVEQSRDKLRTWEMADHEDDLRAAREAVASGRLADAREAGTRLSWPDEVPGIPSKALPWLKRVRAGGEALTGAADIPDAAQALVAITADCAGCHVALGVASARPIGSKPVDAAWLALAFESDEAWRVGVAGMGPDAAALGGSAAWDARRTAFAALLVQTAQRAPGAP